MSKQYYGNLGKDLSSLGVGWQIPGQNTDQLKNYNDLCDFIGATQFIGPVSQAEMAELPHPPTMITTLGKRILKLQNQHASFDGNDNCCGEAEWRLLANIGSASVTNPDRISPVILTEHNEPVGVIKGYGERSCYGLETTPELDIVEGAFSSLHEDADDILDPYTLPPSSHPWQMSLESFPWLHPVRFSVFAVPTPQRRHLDYSTPLESAVLATSHGAIKRRAAALLQQARPVEHCLLEQFA